ncbi:hypothetical protein GCM10023213_20670 [Prosthecobacter algae]|uniref:SPOR domain-containing protein n=1 Tax=Prosthecobacter algae TaxID=1144682 RepID=A0ABP9P2L1_9BACT
MKAFCLLLCLLLTAAFSQPAQAADKPVRVKPSKVSSAKSREREKLFTEWMKADAMAKLSDAKRETGEQMIYYEYHEGKEAYRAIFSKAIQFNGWWRSTIYSEKEMEATVNDYKTKGYAPLFVVLEGNYYSMIFVKPEQLDAARKLTLELGIEPPVVK